MVIRDVAMFAVPVLLQQLLQSLETGSGAGERAAVHCFSILKPVLYQATTAVAEKIRPLLCQEDHKLMKEISLLTTSVLPMMSSLLQRRKMS